MIPSPPAVRLAVPALSAPPGRVAFPVIATLAPVVVSLALWAITQSVYSLMFAALGPIVAVGGLIDGRFSRRAALRRERARFLSALEGLGRRVGEAQRAERHRLRGLGALHLVVDDHESERAISIVDPEPWSGSTGPLPIHLGVATVLGRVELTGDDPEDAPPTISAALAAVRSRAARLDGAPLLVDARDGIGIVAPPIVAAAIARAVVAQLASCLAPDQVAVQAPSAETWALDLPHDVRLADERVYRFSGIDGAELQVAAADSISGLPLGCGVVLRWDGTDVQLVRQPDAVSPLDVRPFALSAGRARALALQLSAAADAHGIRPRSALLPTRVELSDLLGELDRSVPLPGLAAPVGADAHGTLVLDLVADGPHAIVAGTTGSGKSELLVSWVLAMAAAHPPDAVTFLLVDFKGGAAFAPLAGLPHVVGTLSDLDARLTRRAILSLRAELVHRERTLAEHAVRGIDELPDGTLPRLVIVVDEFAAVVSESPDLHDVFADLAARGRSLGLHLVLCTQRPSGVVRDAVLANVPMRLSLRVTDRADSVAMVGSDAAAQLAGDAVGRAILSDARGVRDVQVAIAAPADAAQVRLRIGTATARRPWCDPLPAHIPFADLGLGHDRAALAGAVGGSRIPFGRTDLPHEQQQPVATHDIAAHGHLLVLGAASAGKSTTLDTIAASAAITGVPVLRVPDGPADAWAVLSAEIEGVHDDGATSRLLLIDDLDLLASRIDSDYRHEALDMIARLAREGSGRRLGIVAAAQRLSGPLASLAALFGSRLVLRQTSRDEHVLAGADGGSFDPTLPAGAGWWRGSVVQVASPPVAPGGPVDADGGVGGRRHATIAPYRVLLAAHPVLAIVATRPRPLAAALRAAGVRVHEVGSPAPDELDTLHVATPGPATVLLGDPDAWHGDWAALSRARRDLPIVMIGCTTADHRTLLRDRELPPLLGPGAGECWYADGERTRRGLFVIPDPLRPMDSASESAKRR